MGYILLHACPYLIYYSLRDKILGSPRVENRDSTPGSDRQRSKVYTGITIVHHRDRVKLWLVGASIEVADT